MVADMLPAESLCCLRLNCWCVCVTLTLSVVGAQAELSTAFQLCSLLKQHLQVKFLPLFRPVFLFYSPVSS
jgi:hypothetical protein